MKRSPKIFFVRLDLFRRPSRARLIRPATQKTEKEAKAHPSKLLLMPMISSRDRRTARAMLAYYGENNLDPRSVVVLRALASGTLAEPRQKKWCDPC